MSDCQDIGPLLAAYADDTIEESARARVATHLAGCAACRLAVSAQRQIRDASRGRAAELPEAEPDAVPNHVSATPVPADAVARRSRPSRWRSAPLSATAALVVALAGIIALGTLASPSTVLAAQLTLDHVKCLFVGRDAAERTPEAIASAWQREHGWDIMVPPSSAVEQVELVGFRRCVSTQGEMAHVEYRHAGRPVSLFILPRPGQAGSEVAIMGYETETWGAGNRTYAVVGRIPREDLARVTAYLRGRVR